MEYGICCVPVSPMRAEPSHRSEMVSQLIFGEHCTILEQSKDRWVKIRTSFDGYEGWCQELQLQMSDQDYEKDSVTLTRENLSAISYKGSPMYLPMGACLEKINNAGKGGQILVSGNTIDPASTPFDPALLKELAFNFFNTSYLWGGRTNFGVDCSGFCQTVYRFFNVRLQRDAYLQATQGDVVGFLQEATCGDLAFFDNEEGRITHVGILLSPTQIIHASVKVRVDNIDNMGIINTDNRERTHKLRIIKRVVV